MFAPSAPRSLRRPPALLLPALLVVAACQAEPEAAANAAPEAEAMDPNRAAFLTLLGEDTLVAEWMEFREDGVSAQALIRGSRTTWHEFELDLAEDGTITGWEAATFAATPGNAEPLRSDVLEIAEDGTLQLMMTRGEETSTRPFEAAPGEVPFVDFLHWPFELALRRQAAAGTLGRSITILGGRVFEVEDAGDGLWRLVHPSRGPSTFRMDDGGRITELDGTGSTRAYDLRRVAFDAIDPDDFRAAFADRPLGELSGRGEVDTEVAGVRFTGDFGTPRRRGREIFGRLVAYGERWRTGANRATHLSFDGDIVVDGRTIPAGDYTLYSIPEAEGGTLIVNRATGQTGTRYDESMDEARLDLRREALDENVEVFDIRVVPDGDGGRIELRWAETVYYVPFTAG